MYLKFSYDGLKLAVATGKIINIYSVPEYKLLKQLIGHQGKLIKKKNLILKKVFKYELIEFFFSNVYLSICDVFL